MVLSIKWEQAEFEVNREHQTIQIFISMKQKIKYAFIKTEFEDERNESKNRRLKASLKWM